MKHFFAGIFTLLSTVSIAQEYDPVINVLNLAAESAKVQAIEHENGDRSFLILSLLQDEEEVIGWDGALSEHQRDDQRLLEDSDSPVVNFLSVTDEADFRVITQRNGDYILLVMPTHGSALSSLCEKKFEEWERYILSITPPSAETLPAIREHCYQ